MGSLGFSFISVLYLFAPFVCAGVRSDAPVTATLPPAGPYHVAGSRIIDAVGREFLMRGTTMPTVTLNKSDIDGDGKQFGPFSRSSFTTLRQRMNMNTIRVPLDTQAYRENAEYRARVKEIVRKANELELLVILAADQPDASFWARCAAEFKVNPNVFFRLASGGDVGAIRASGATQPVIVAGDTIADPNVIYEVTPSYATTRTDAERQTQFGFLSGTVPVLVNGLDPQLDHVGSECAAFPADPAEASRLVEDNLNYFDSHHISWTLSSFLPGRMITEYRFYNWSKLDDGWTCGESPSRSGIAMMLQSHLWNRNPHGLFPVNPTTGNFVLPRGAISSAYGPILAERDMTASARPLPTVLGNVAVDVTDSRGVKRTAPLLYTGGGWSLITFVVPAASATGPAEIAVVRTDGSRSTGKVVIADFAPGFWAASADGRGAVIGTVFQRFANGRTRTFETADCSVYGCRPVAIPLAPRVATTIRLEGSGFRYAGPRPDIRATVGDFRVPIVSVTRGEIPEHDRLTIELPDELRGRGETDLMVNVNGIWSNVVRINCGSL